MENEKNNMSVVKWATIGDLHLKLTDSLGKYDKETGYNTRILDKINMLKNTSKKIVEFQPDFVIFLGDIFDSVNPSDRLRALFINSISEILQHQEIKIFILIGNHDTDGQFSPFDADSLLLDCIKKGQLYIIYQPYKLKVKDKHFYMNPWGTQSKIKDVNKKDRENSVLFGHFTVEGARMNSRWTAKGVEISKKMIKDFKKVELGHIHRRQEFYVGSLFRNTFGERDDEKGFNLNVWDGEVINTEFVDSNDRKFIQYETNCSEVEKLDIPKDSICKLVIKDDRSRLRELNRKVIKENLEKKAFKIKIETEVEEGDEKYELKSDGKISDFFEVLYEISSDNNLTDYIRNAMEGIE